MKHLFIILIGLFFLNCGNQTKKLIETESPISSQGTTKTMYVTGSFYNFETGEPECCGAVILLEDANDKDRNRQGTITDLEGKFSLKLELDREQSMLHFKGLIGFRELLIPIDGKTANLDIENIPVFKGPEMLAFILTTPQYVMKQKQRKHTRKYLKSAAHQEIVKQIKNYQEIRSNGDTVRFDCLDKDCLKLRLNIK